MENFKFNTLYIVESLRDGDTKTGYALYEDLKLQEYFHEHVKVIYKSIQSKSEWNTLMNEILTECSVGDVYPILHLEIHGDEQGIQFSNGETCTLEETGEQFRKINIATGCNLFLTMGVCKGLYVLLDAHLEKPMPFCGVIGSFEKLIAGDIQLRYAAFYESFFSTFNITEAYVQLMKTETGLPEQYSHYRYIHVDEIFYKTYLNYIKIACASDGMKQRALDAAEENNVEFASRQQKRKFQRDFKKEEKKSRNLYYLQAATSFFMLDKFPKNRTRFNVPDSYEQLEKRCKQIATI